MNTGKVIQISANGYTLVALCDDGTIWCSAGFGFHDDPVDWRRIPEPPTYQPDDE